MALKTYKIQSFFGIDQSSDENNISPSCSPDAVNMSTDGGRLSVAKGYEKYITDPVPGSDRIRYMTCFRSANDDCLPVVAAGDNYYCYSGGQWNLIHTIVNPANTLYFESEMLKIGDTDYLVISDGRNQLIKFDGETVTSFGSAEHCSDVPVSYLAMYRNRLFSAGDRRNPNRLYYSVLPGGGRTLEDWGPVAASPSVEGGHVEVGSGGGDPIIALHATSNQLLIFKKHSVYRLIGDRPSNFTIEKIDTNYQSTQHKVIASYGDTVFFLTADGLYYYNGVNARPNPDHSMIRNIMKDAKLSSSHLVIIKDKLYFSLKCSGVDKLVVYDLTEHKYMLHDGFPITWIMDIAGELMIVNTNRYIYRFGVGTSYDGVPIEAHWSTPLTDLGSKAEIKALRSLMLRGSGGTVKVTASIGKRTLNYFYRLPKSRSEVVELPLSDEGRCFSLTLSNSGGSSFELEGGIEILFSSRMRTV